MLEPVVPGPGGRPSAIAAYKVCISPLSLIVELAPLGALNQLLASYRKSGARLALSVIKDSTMQSENVLVWHFPHPFSVQLDVLLKLGDYGISRSVLPSGGAKGFGGTEGFMAPEIVRFNGEEEYTQKVEILIVDCFSFGMFLYELITLKLPFEGEEHVKERLLEGARPVLLPHELLFPSPMLDLLVHCWSAHPESRPSSSQLVGYCSAPEFTHVLDVCELEESHPPFSILPLPTGDIELDDPDDFEAQLWLNGRDITVMSCTQFGWLDRKCIASPIRARFLSHVRDTVWSCDEAGRVTVFTSSLYELSTIQLPFLNSPLIQSPEFIGADIILLVGERQLQLLRLSEYNSIISLGTMDSPFPIRTATFVQQSNSRWEILLIIVNKRIQNITYVINSRYLYKHSFVKLSFLTFLHDFLLARTTLSSTSSESGLGWVRERMSETMDRIRGSPAPTCSHNTSESIIPVCIGSETLE
uniref:Protein kinase domain-containing protein n=1 Tax=Heterorhabditis bacteriophora TaxID=37862 RepID=A0A1I7XMK0_HETBA